MHQAAGGLAVIFLTAGCAGVSNTPDVHTATGRTLLSAYQKVVATNGLSASLTELVESGTDPIAEGQGTTDLWFGSRSGETRLTVDTTATVVALRTSDEFYEGKTASTVGANRQDLSTTAREDPQSMPEIQAPGVDPFQITTLLSAIQWPDTILDVGPVVVSDSTGQHTEYEMTLDTSRLAGHVGGTDRAWLSALAAEPGGKTVTLDATLSGGVIASVTARVPLPNPQLPSTKSVPTYLPSPAPVTITITETFDYGKPAQKVTPPV